MGTLLNVSHTVTFSCICMPVLKLMINEVCFGFEVGLDFRYCSLKEHKVWPGSKFYFTMMQLFFQKRQLINYFEAPLILLNKPQQLHLSQVVLECESCQSLLRNTKKNFQGRSDDNNKSCIFWTKVAYGLVHANIIFQICQI